MSTSPYSEDLRLRVIKYLAKGNGYKEGSKLFELSISTIGRWYRRYKQEGHCQAKVRVGAQRKINLEALECYVNTNPDMKLKEAAIVFRVSTWTIHYWLKEIGFSYKKKRSPMWKQTKKNESNI
jgi:transposase